MTVILISRTRKENMADKRTHEVEIKLAKLMSNVGV
jgi:hypothetical protein